MKKYLSLIIVFGVLFLSSCAENVKQEDPADPVYHKITAEEAMEIMESGKDYILLDVRTEEEYGEKRIDGALLIPNTEIADRAEEELPDKDATILVYCRSGRRSADASYILVEMGYTGVYDFGGINDWPYDTVSG